MISATMYEKQEVFSLLTSAVQYRFSYSYDLSDNALQHINTKYCRYCSRSIKNSTGAFIKYVSVKYNG